MNLEGKDRANNTPLRSPIEDQRISESSASNVHRGSSRRLPGTLPPEEAADDANEPPLQRVGGGLGT